MNIGRLAAASGTAVETIRWYERIGLLPTAARSAGNYRIYGAAELDRLRFIRHCRMLDMAIDEIRTLLHALDHPAADDGDCAAINALLDQHLGHVEARIAELQQLREQLQTLRQQCATPGQIDRCGILAALSSTARSTSIPGEPTTAAGTPARAHPHVARTHGMRPQRHDPAPRIDRRAHSSGKKSGR